MDKACFYHLITFGCQMNKNDSERIAGLLDALGLQSTNQPEQADLLVVNTCSVRQSAEDRVFGAINNWQKLRAARPDLLMAVTGCLPGRDQDGKLKNKLPGVDLFFPISELNFLPQRLRALNPDLFDADFEDLTDYWQLNPRRQENFRAFITIQTGCNNFCSYCVVPYARGREKNRPLKDILEEIKSAVENGCKEITLLGQVVNNYQASDAGNFGKDNVFCHHDSKSKDDFAALLWEANQIAGLERVYFTAADPQYFSQAQIQALALPKMANYLHLPAQSGDNEILKKMNRKYTREDYLDLIKKIRAIKPEIAIGTDIIVGFCGETEAQFQNTVDLYKKCDFDIAYPARYSQRSGTLAAKKFKDDVPRAEKKRRWEVLQELMEEITRRKNQKYLGKTVSVLVDNCADGYCSGNSGEMKLTRFPGENNLLGQIATVKIEQADIWLLSGRVL